ncbi:MAG: DUF2950 domain-containing protein [Candidatus Binataceae bacterium]
MLQVIKDNRSAAGRAALALLLIGLAIGLATLRSAFAQEPGQKVFSSPAEAGDALAAAAQKHDKPAMLAILGHSAQDLISSGDPVEDKSSEDLFATKYHETHRFVATVGGRVFIYLGAENWPAPIPLQKSGTQWYFDTPYGSQVVLYRQIGSNELNVMEVCDQIVAAEQEYYAALHDGDPVHQYAQRFRSTAGKQDGLYWKVSSGQQPESPLGPMVAEATREGYSSHNHAAGQPRPFHGYLYRLLTRQGADAPGGAKDYIVDGKMTGGFALVADPMIYRTSGVMTFMVNQDGQIFQKDLGPQTEKTATEMTKYNPDATWEPLEEAQATNSAASSVKTEK